LEAISGFVDVSGFDQHVIDDAAAGGLDPKYELLVHGNTPRVQILKTIATKLDSPIRH
jgi:hypothetical protein